MKRRVDWLVAVKHASEAKLKVEARGSKYADAMEKTFTDLRAWHREVHFEVGQDARRQCLRQTRHSERTPR